MGDKSKIEWTDATWNPVRGCSIVSKGCANCYAMRQAHRSSGAGGAYEGLTKLTKGGPVWTGEIREVDELLTLPLKWKRPRHIFVNSMSDLFHERVHGDFIDAILDTIKLCHLRGLGHVFQVLTKRAARLQALMKYYEPLPNLWLGVSVEDQAAADERIPLLLQTPATVRWISAEPLIGPLNLEAHLAVRRWRADGRWYDEEEGTDGGIPTRLHWVVAGGESGPGARPMHPDWARALRNQCAAAGVAFFFKQWGAWGPRWASAEAVNVDQATARATNPNAHMGPKGLAVQGRDTVFRVGKKAAGRELDGRTHDEYPA